MKFINRFAAIAVSTIVAASITQAAPVFWADWTGVDQDPGTGFTGSGTITTGTTTVGVTYSNPQGVSFYQSNGGTDYFTHSGAGASPYTSTRVDNRPTGSDIIGLQFAGTQSLLFSQTVTNPVFSFVSLNGNGYAFNRDFDILSVGDGTNNACGFWGCGFVQKQVVEVTTGVFEYRLLGSGEPHGTIGFLGQFDSITWQSLSNENWNGFTVGVGGTRAEFCALNPNEPGCGTTPQVPLAPTALFALVGLGLMGRTRRS